MITVTIKGPQGEGKTKLAKVIEQVVRHKAYQKRQPEPSILIVEAEDRTPSGKRIQDVQLLIVVKQ